MKLILLFLIVSVIALADQSRYEIEGIVFTDQTDQNNEIDSQADLSNITKDQLEGINSSSGSVDDLLRLSPAATTSRGPRSSSESVQVRGLDNNKIFVMIDGSRQRFQSAHTSMIGLDTENIKAINVYKASSDTNFSNTLGGGVNFITIDPKDVLRKNKKNTSEFTTKFNSANQEKAINAKSAYKNKQTSGLVSISYADANDLKLNNSDELGNSSYQDFAGLAKIKYKKFTLKLEHFNRSDNSPIDPSLDPPEDFKDLYSDNTTTRNNVTLAYKSKDDLESNIYVNQYEQIKDRDADQILDTRTLTTTGLNFDKKLDSFNFGAETFFDKLSSDRNGEVISSYPNANAQYATIYVTKKTNIINKLSLNTDLKQHAYSLSSKNNEINASKITKGAKLTFSANKNLQIYTAYSEGFNAPRVNDVYAEGLHSVGDGFFIRDNFFITNENLREETSKDYEAGFSYKASLMDSRAYLKLDANIYRKRVDDYIYMQRIDRSVVDAQDGITQFVNIPDVELSGTELALNYIYNSYDLRLSYSQVRGKNLSEDIYLSDLPADSYNIQFKYMLDRYDLTLGYLGHLALKQDRVNPETIERTDPTASYLIHSVFASKSLDDFDISLRVDNVGNKKYRRHASHLNEAQEDIKLSIKYIIDTI